jgi:hypothetical protein
MFFIILSEFCFSISHLPSPKIAEQSSEKSFNNHGIEIRSSPDSLAACRRGFAFYLADPVGSVHE